MKRALAAVLLAFSALIAPIAFGVACEPPPAPPPPDEEDDDDDPDEPPLDPGRAAACAFDVSDPSACVLLEEPRDPCPGYRGDQGVWYALPEAGAPSALSALWAGRYLAAFDGTATGALYDICESSWRVMPDENRPAYAIYYAVAGQKLVVFGDSESAGVFDFAAQRWSSMDTRDMPQFAGVLVGLDGYLIALDGYLASPTLDLGRMSIYDVAADRWRLAPAPPNGSGYRDGYAFAVAGTRLFAWGGVDYDNAGAPRYHDDGWLYDVAADAWTTLAAEGAPRARAGAMAAAAGERVVIFGGYDESFQQLDDGHVFDLASSTWSPLPPANAPTGRIAGRLLPLSDGFAVLGGYNVATGIADRDGARFTFASQEWTTLPGDNGPFDFTSAPRVFATANDRVVAVQPGLGADVGGAWVFERGDGWRALDIGPLGRVQPSLVWTGTRLASWAGYDPFTFTPILNGAQIVP